MTRTFKQLFLLCLLIFIYTSCEDLENIGDIDEVAIDAQFALPIINTKLTLDELFEEDDDRQSFLDIAPDGSMTIMFDTKGPEVAFVDVITIPSSIPFNATENGFKVNLQPNNGFDVSEIELKSGTLQFSVSSSMEENVDVTLMIPELTSDGEMFTTNVSLEYTPGSGPMTKSVGPMDVSNYKITLDNGEMTIMYSANSASGSVTLDGASGQANGFGYKTIKGSWTNEIFTLPNEIIPMDIYDNWQSGELTFADPKIRIDVSSNVGFPSAYVFDAVSATNVNNSGSNLSGAVIGMVNELLYPGLTEIGSTETTSIYVDKDNSNIDDFFADQLTELDIALSVQTNPNNPTLEGFITDDASISSDVFVELPVYGKASGFTLINEFDADIADVENIKEAEFTIDIVNGIPVDLDVQLYFKDDQGIILDSLFVDNMQLIESAVVDGNGDVSSTTTNTIIQTVNESRAQIIFNATKKMDIKAVLSTVNDGNTNVRLNANQEMDIQVGARITVQD